MCCITYVVFYNKGEEMPEPEQLGKVKKEKDGGDSENDQGDRG